jgi:hypothetical protein
MALGLALFALLDEMVAVALESGTGFNKVCAWAMGRRIPPCPPFSKGGTRVLCIQGIHGWRGWSLMFVIPAQAGIQNDQRAGYRLPPV